MANIIVCLITFVVCLILAYLITEIKNKILILSKSKTIRICIVSLFSIIVLFCVVNFLFPKNTKISEDEQSEYKTVENSITCNVDNAYLVDDGVYMDGWAFIADNDTNNYKIGVIVNNDIYLANKVIRQDVKDYYSLKNAKVGFSIVLDNNENFEICIVDQKNKIIYNNSFFANFY